MNRFVHGFVRPVGGRRPLLVAGWFLSAACLLPRPAMGEQVDVPRIIRVGGQAVATAEPDRARIAVSVVTRAATAREASKGNATISKGVLAKLRALVTSPGTVRTSGYNLAAEYEYNQKRTGVRGRTLVGYVATNRLAVVTSDLAGVGALLDEAVAAGASHIDSIGFYLADESPVRRRALEEAGQQARVEAEAVARGLGVGLGHVLDASTVAEAVPRPSPVRGRSMAMEAAAAPTEVVPGSLEIRASVTVTFAIR